MDAKRVLEKRIDRFRNELEKSEASDEAKRRESEASNFTGIWGELYDSGFKPRLIIILQNREKTTREIAAICGVTPGRIAEQKHWALAMLRHPSRRGIAERLGITDEQRP